MVPIKQTARVPWDDRRALNAGLADLHEMTVTEHPLVTALYHRSYEPAPICGAEPGRGPVRARESDLAVRRPVG